MPIRPDYRFLARNWYSGMNLNQGWQSSFFQGRIFCLELSAFFLTLLKDSIFAAGGKTVFIVEFINLQQAVKCGQRMRKIFGHSKNLPQKVSP